MDKEMQEYLTAYVNQRLRVIDAETRKFINEIRDDGLIKINKVDDEAAQKRHDEYMAGLHRQFRLSTLIQIANTVFIIILLIILWRLSS